MNNEKRSGCFWVGPTSTERIIHVGTHGPCVRPVRNSPKPPDIPSTGQRFPGGLPRPYRNYRTTPLNFKPRSIHCFNTLVFSSFEETVKVVCSASLTSTVR